MKERSTLIKQFSSLFLLVGFSLIGSAQNDLGLMINDQEYFERPGLNVMVYHDYYPVGRQGGITIIQNGIRVTANGDIRLTPSERPYPDHGERMINRDSHEIRVEVGYPDSTRNKQRDQRYSYPDLLMKSIVKVKAEGNAVRISVDLDQPVPEKWIGKVGFSMELFPGHFFDKTYYMDETPGIFPRQANGPMSYNKDGEIEIKPMARGRKLVVLPDSEDQMIVFESLHNELALLDGRGRRNAGWFIIRSPLRTGVTENAVEWLISPSISPDYKYEPVIQVSQVGYHPNQKKVAVIELDKSETTLAEMSLLRINETGGYDPVKKGKPNTWGDFLRYHYARFDFSEVQKPGMYKLKYGESLSNPFMIQESVFERHVWQPTLEYYLPVQMCHMRVNDRVKVWHGLCHEDDALMAPVSHFHFDGYRQGPSTLTQYEPADPVSGLNIGGWHDAGDYDLRVESQANTVRMLAYVWELFGNDYDETTVDQAGKLVEIHRPDGQPDILQQIEHGVLTINGGYKALGRLYRGIICPTGRQYSMLGDGSTMTDNLVFNSSLDSSQVDVAHSGIMDDRWVFTEENPRRELFVSACLATAYRSLKGYRESLANESLQIAQNLWEMHQDTENLGLIDAAAELYLSTGDEKYKSSILSRKEQIVKNIQRIAPALARIVAKIDDEGFMTDVRTALHVYAKQVTEQMNETPYGVRYKPRVWGAGWNIQSFGVNQYFLHKGFPEIFSADGALNSLNFVLGVHPGINTASFVSGVGAESLLVAYGVNRDDWSFIPGGSASGTALIRPDLPELKTWPYLWQQTEYVMGGGATNYMFLVLAAQELMADE